MAYRLVNGSSLPKPRKVNKHASVSTEFRGNGKSALSTRFTDSTLGQSTRQGWRLSCTPAERKAHGAKVTRNTAAFVAHPSPMLFVTAPDVTRAAVLVNKSPDILDTAAHADAWRRGSFTYAE